MTGGLGETQPSSEPASKSGCAGARRGEIRRSDDRWAWDGPWICASRAAGVQDFARGLGNCCGRGLPLHVLVEPALGLCELVPAGRGLRKALEAAKMSASGRLLTLTPQFQKRGRTERHS
jgi:hypothetical protein